MKSTRRFFEFVTAGFRTMEEGVCFYSTDDGLLKNTKEGWGQTEQTNKWMSVEADLWHAIQKMIYLQYARVGFPSEW